MTEQNNEKEKFTISYIQQQERYIMELLRDKFNSHIQFMNTVEVLENYKRLYEESQKQIKQQNEVIQQASISIEKLTKDLKICEEVSADKQKTIENFNEKLIEYEHLKQIHQSAKNEINRLNDCVNALSEENNKMNAELSESDSKSSFVKKERPKTKKITNEDTF